MSEKPPKHHATSALVRASAPLPLQALLRSNSISKVVFRSADRRVIDAGRGRSIKQNRLLRGLCRLGRIVDKITTAERSLETTRSVPALQIEFHLRVRNADDYRCVSQFIDFNHKRLVGAIDVIKDDVPGHDCSQLKGSKVCFPIELSVHERTALRQKQRPIRTMRRRLSKTE